MTVRSIAIGASYNLHSPSIALEKVVLKLVDDIVHERKCISTNLLRSNDGIDDLKFLYPVMDNLPILAFPIVTAIETGCKVTVVGSTEVGALCSIIQEELKVKNLQFIHEGENLSLLNTLLKISDAHNGMISFSTGDLLRFDHYSDLIDPSSKDSDFVYTMNVKQRLPTITHRNYYLCYHPLGVLGYLFTPLGKGPVQAKEGNQFLITSELIQKAQEIFSIYNNRKGTEQVNWGIEMLGKKIYDHPLKFINLSLSAGVYMALHKKNLARFFPLSWLFKENFMSLLLNNGSTNYHANIKFGFENYAHHDPLKMWDMDSLEDFSSMRLVMPKIIQHYPQRESLFRVQRAIEGNKESIPLLHHFEEFLAQKLAVLQQSISSFPEFFSVKAHHYYDGLSSNNKKKINGYLLPKLLENGRMTPLACNGLNVSRLDKYIRKVGVKKYYKSQKVYHSLINHPPKSEE